MTERNQPLIIDQQMTSRGQVIQDAPITIGIVSNNNGNYPNLNNNQYVGQPPGMYPNPPPYNPNGNYNGYNGYNGGMYENRPLGPPPPPPQNLATVIPGQIMNHPQIIVIKEKLLQVCPSCGFLGSLPRRTAGCVTFSWCVCLFCFTGLFCFWVPFCIDSCYDVEVVCSRCGFVKAVIQANCM